MSPGFTEFLLALQDDDTMLRRYRLQDLPALVVSARAEGFAFTGEQARSAVLTLELAVALEHERNGVNSAERLWRDRWGTTYLEYLVDSVAGRFTEPELHRLLAGVS
ncbi:hypothetical protein ACIA8O_24655 [Kitasatospora sp. NPDC051853]|uniref:hypothetical protein n=1 Tax=Kitasatospora sp. NPDC051853 TaxID=3364058 RepID=UPI0037BD5758